MYFIFSDQQSTFKPRYLIPVIKLKRSKCSMLVEYQFWALFQSVYRNVRRPISSVSPVRLSVSSVSSGPVSRHQQWCSRRQWWAVIVHKETLRTTFNEARYRACAVPQLLTSSVSGPPPNCHSSLHLGELRNPAHSKKQRMREFKGEDEYLLALLFIHRLPTAP